MASSPITSWQIDGETVGTESDFIFWGSKITADGDCSHEIKRHLLLGRKVMTNLDSIFKSRDITLSTKVRLVKVMVFPLVMYGCESWTIKKAECWRIDAFELWFWRRLLRVPWTARRSNQSILKEISPGCSLEGLMLKLKLQYLATWCEDSFEKTLMLGKIEGGRRRGWQRMRWMASLTWWTWAWVSSRSWWWTGKAGVLQSMGLQKVGHNLATKLNWLNYWKEGILLLQVDHKSFEICCTFHPETKEELSTRNKFKGRVGNKRKLVRWLCSWSFAYSTSQLHSTDGEWQMGSSKKGVGWQIRRPPTVLLGDLYMWETIMMKMLKAM